ncbi:hypothetical protein Pan44_16290 [Caulifigura coniformis]|uniref:Uncharacterized protein n=1 Tax=Caulifigura coniformis TaxID=2527983 RepID=A0A517SBU5_9PLAN|nr:hypothetical protein [Caulifigura coniformis]QDT53607.1 hypothetical protein Pan44_16290 [Caulifigura coniformis]
MLDEQAGNPSFWAGLWDQAKGIVIGTVGTAAVGGIYLWIVESRRRINFIAEDVYFGPTLNFNPFMARNYPSEDLVSLDCEVRFFSNKTQTTGLHNFRMEFCRTSYIGSVVEFTLPRDKLHRNIMKKEGPFSLETLELPPREFVSFSLHTIMQREDWPALRSCDSARLVCETPEGKTKRFAIGRFRFPDMPPDGIRGLPLMSVEIIPREQNWIIRALRRYEGQMFYVPNPPPDDVRYWAGPAWSNAPQQAEVYKDQADARAAGEKVKIWNIVPPEWLEKVKR